MSNQLDASVAKRLDITVKQNQTFDPVLTFTDDEGVPTSFTTVFIISAGIVIGSINVTKTIII